MLNYGNVGGNKNRRTLFSLIGTILIISGLFVPTFIYESRIPHHETVIDEYQNIVPQGPFAKNLTVRPGEIALLFDFKCRSAKDFCNVHRELQGIRYPADPTKLTYEERNVCLTLANETEIYSLAQYCTNSTCVIPNIPSNLPKCAVDDDCVIADHEGVCGKKEDTSTSDYVCCPSGRKVETSNGQVCSNQALNSPCVLDSICDSRKCGNGFCESDVTKVKKSVGGTCNNDKNCTSDFCNPNGICDIEPVLCPTFSGDLSLSIEDAIVVPRNVSEEEFCLLNADIQLFTQTNCSTLMNELESAGFIKIAEKTAENRIRTSTPNYTILENALRENFSKLIFYFSFPVAFVLIGYQLFLYFRGDNVRHRSYDLKCAAKVKLDGLITNAMKFRENMLNDKVEGEVMRNYLLQREVTEPIASLKWTFDALRSRLLMVKYGIHVPARIYTALGLQAIVLTAYFFAAIFLIEKVAKDLDKFLEDEREARSLGKDIVEWIRQGGQSQIKQEDELLEKLPKGWMIRASLYPAALIGEILGLSTFFVLIPSFVASIVRFRKGRLPSLRDNNFNILRTQSDSVNQNLGNVVFSLLGTCILTAIILALLIFLCVYPVTQPIVKSIVALVTGIALSAIVSIVLQTVFRSKLYVALYRVNPSVANVYTIFFEAWNFVNALITVVKRIALVFLQAFAFLNRIDIPFIDKDIGSDAVANNFRKEVLVHEAHNHPYIDRLCGMYLRRLRDGPLFGSRVGQVWRSAFVIGLCPWLIKYRVNAPENVEQAKTERSNAASLCDVTGNEKGNSLKKENTVRSVTNRYFS